MSKVFYRKQFSDYLGEQRAIDDIIAQFIPDGGITPTPSPVPVTPTPTPTKTSTPTPTPSITPSVTSTLTPTPTNTGTPTPTPTRTPAPACDITYTELPSPTPSPTPTITPTNTGTPTPTPTASAGPTYDPSAQLFFNAITASGGTLTNTEKSAVNTLVIDLKGYGLWTKMDALYPFVGSGSTEQKYNLKDPQDLDASYRLGFSAGWTFNVSGATPNGTSAFANTYFAPNNKGQNDVHISVWNTQESTGTRVEMGSTAGGADIQIVSNFGGTNYSSVNNGGQSGGPVTSKGFVLVSRTGSTSFNYFLNNSKTIKSQTSVLPNAFSMYIGCRNNSGSGEYFDTKQKAFASIGDGLNDIEVANFYTSVLAFQTTLGRQN